MFDKNSITKTFETATQLVTEGTKQMTDMVEGMMKNSIMKTSQVQVSRVNNVMTVIALVPAVLDEQLDISMSEDETELKLVVKSLYVDIDETIDISDLKDPKVTKEMKLGVLKLRITGTEPEPEDKDEKKFKKLDI